jgi:hypothetical protein
MLHIISLLRFNFSQIQPATPKEYIDKSSEERAFPLHAPSWLLNEAKIFFKSSEGRAL